MAIYLKDEELERLNDTPIDRYNTELLHQIIRRAELLLSNIGVRVTPGKIVFKVVDENEMHGLYPKMKASGLTCSISISEKTHKIWLLENLPYIGLLSVVAHEMGHVWCSDHRIRLSRMEEEGFCQLLAYHVLSTQFSKHGNSWMKWMLEDPDLIYGDGLRHMKKQFSICGTWMKFLGFMRLSK